MGMLLKIGAKADENTLEILGELTRLAASGELRGFAYVAEVHQKPAPLFGVLGRFNVDPWLGLAILGRLRAKLERLAEASEQKAVTPPAKVMPRLG